INVVLIIQTMFMKIKLSALLICVFFTQVAMSQFTLGVKGGVNLTKIDGRAFKDEFSTGYHAGAFLELKLGGRVGLQPEVLFNQINTRRDTAFRDVFTPNFQDVKLNYLSIPVLLTYKLGNILYLQAGPQFGILMKQDENLLRNGEEAFKNGDFSLLGGAQLRFSKLRLSGRYFVGLNNISDIDKQDEWKNQGWQLSLGLAL
ncbi:MAG TPA: porin family protein, partial [Flavisolibacter sp.]|nr:porin family protein [Flavisolibacter sp.]